MGMWVIEVPLKAVVPNDAQAVLFLYGTMLVDLPFVQIEILDFTVEFDDPEKIIFDERAVLAPAPNIGAKDF